jgi:hypothetical protein
MMPTGGAHAGGGLHRFTDADLAASARSKWPAEPVSGERLAAEEFATW